MTMGIAIVLMERFDNTKVFTRKSQQSYKTPPVAFYFLETWSMLTIWAKTCGSRVFRDAYVEGALKLMFELI